MEKHAKRSKRSSKALKKEARRALEDQIAKRTKGLEAQVAYFKDLSHLKDEFIRITNHELRTPLDVIRGNVDMVLKGEAGQISEKTKEYLGDALAGADRLTKLVDAILDISRIETGRMKFTLEDIDLTSLVKTLENEFKPLAQKRQLALLLEIPSKPLFVFSDRGKLFQILDNLLGNALKFTPEGGSITINVRGEEETVFVSIKDTGIGMKLEDQSKIFKQFPQIEGSTIQASKGAGLGLYLAWQLVEKLGGQIWGQSQGLGKGTTFSFRLPRSNTDRAKALARYHSIFLASEGT